MKTIITRAVLIFSGLTAFSKPISTIKNLNKMEQEKITQTVKELFDSADKHNWTKIQNTFAENVLLDYTSMVGGNPTNQTPIQIIDAWSSFLPGFDKTKHNLSNFIITIDNDIAKVNYLGKADHFLNNEIWTVKGSYETELLKSGKNWSITKHKFNLQKQTGNTNLPAKASEIMKNRNVRKVEFISEGLVIKGNLYLPNGFNEKNKYKTLIVTGSWTTVKEQMPALYAKQMADNGFVALTFDFRYFGESEGLPREYENPSAKIKDIQNAVTYLSSLKFVDNSEIGGMGVCASTGYMSYAAATDKRIKTIVLLAPWLHNAELVEMIYGNRKGGVKSLIEKSEADEINFAKTGNSTHILAASETDETAAMFTPPSYNFDYYINPSKGAISQWKNNFSLMSWKPWLTFDGVAAAKEIKQPVYIVHSESGAIPQGTKQFYSLLSGEKDITWLNQYTQLDLYIEPQAVKDASNLAVKWFNNHLN